MVIRPTVNKDLLSGVKLNSTTISYLLFAAEGISFDKMTVTCLFVDIQNFLMLLLAHLSTKCSW